MRQTKTFVPFLCLLLAGCGDSGPDLYEVSGTITNGGQPLPNVSVTFAPTQRDLPSSAGVTDAQGNFTLTTTTGETGAVAGLHKVILGVAVTGEFDYQAEMARRNQSNPGARSSAPPAEAETPFPKEYASGDTTPKEVEVTAGGENAFKIDVAE